MQEMDIDSLPTQPLFLINSLLNGVRRTKIGQSTNTLRLMMMVDKWGYRNTVTRGVNWWKKVSCERTWTVENSKKTPHWLTMGGCGRFIAWKRQSLSPSSARIFRMCSIKIKRPLTPTWSSKISWNVITHPQCKAGNSGKAHSQTTQTLVISRESRQALMHAQMQSQ